MRQQRLLAGIAATNPLSYASHCVYHHFSNSCTLRTADINHLDHFLLSSLGDNFAASRTIRTELVSTYLLSRDTHTY